MLKINKNFTHEGCDKEKIVKKVKEKYPKKILRINEVCEEC